MLLSVLVEGVGAPVDMTGKPDYVMKLVLIGSTGAGKSSLVVRFADDRFRGEHLTTIGVDFKVVTIDMGGKLVKLQIWLGNK